jgi:hypothetical protein
MSNIFLAMNNGKRSILYAVGKVNCRSGPELSNALPVGSTLILHVVQDATITFITAVVHLHA